MLKDISAHNYNFDCLSIQQHAQANSSALEQWYLNFLQAEQLYWQHRSYPETITGTLAYMVI